MLTGHYLDILIEGQVIYTISNSVLVMVIIYTETKHLLFAYERGLLSLHIYEVVQLRL